MSKTVEIQIEKCRNLVEGLRKHLNGNGTGVTTDEITAMKKAMEELEAANTEVERLREELAPKVKHTNELLEQVKNAYLEKKALIKGTYPQEKWLEYGVPDKRQSIANSLRSRWRLGDFRRAKSPCGMRL